jgi:hypothetical protein
MVLRGHQLRAVRLMVQVSDTLDLEENERAQEVADGKVRSTRNGKKKGTLRCRSSRIRVTVE